MAQTGRSNVRYVDPQRRYTVVLGPSWNAPFGALPHDDRAGTHDSADGRCGSYVSIGCGQAALWITSKKFCGFAAMRHSRRLLTAAGQRVAETLSERGELSGDEVDALLGGAAEQRQRHGETERLGGLEIDRQLEIGRCLHGKIGRACALENPIDILGRAGKCFPQVDAIGYQTALSRHESKWIHRGHAVPVLVSLFLM